MSVVVGQVIVDVFIPESLSLKDKRSVLQSVIRRIAQKFNVSIAEVGEKELWQRASIAIAVVGDSTGFVQRQLQTVVAFIDNEPRLQVTNVDYQWR